MSTRQQQWRKKTRSPSSFSMASLPPIHPQCFMMFRLIVLHISTCKRPNASLDAMHRLMVEMLALLLQPGSVRLQGKGSSKLQSNLCYIVLEYSQSRGLTNSYAESVRKCRFVFTSKSKHSAMQNVVHKHWSDFTNRDYLWVILAQGYNFFSVPGNQGNRERCWRRSDGIGSTSLAAETSLFISLPWCRQGSMGGLIMNYKRKAVGGKRLACALSACAQQALHASPASFLFMFFWRLRTSAPFPPSKFALLPLPTEVQVIGMCEHVLFE